MLLSNWALALSQSFWSIVDGLIQFIPNIIAAVVIFIIGWLVGATLGKLVMQIVKSLRVDDALKAAGVEKALSHTGYKLDSGAVLGTLVKWFFIVVFLVGSLQVLGLTEVNVFLRSVVLNYIPQVIVAVLMLLVAAVLADAVQKLVAGSAMAANMKTANLLGSVARYAIWIFAILVVLAQLRVATGFIETLFTGVVVALALAFGLSFGLGGQQAAARAIEKMQQELKG